MPGLLHDQSQGDAEDALFGKQALAVRDQLVACVVGRARHDVTIRPGVATPHPEVRDQPCQSVAAPTKFGIGLPCMEHSSV